MFLYFRGFSLEKIAVLSLKYSKNPHTRTCGLRTPRLKFGKKGAYRYKNTFSLKIENVLIYKNSSLFSFCTVSVALLWYCTKISVEMLCINASRKLGCAINFLMLCVSSLIFSQSYVFHHS